MKVTVEFEEGDFDSLHDIVYSLTEVKLSHDELEKVFRALPEDFQADAIHWGISDTAVRENIYEYLQKKLNGLDGD